MEALLDSYHAERHPIGRLTLQMTHVFHSSLTLRRRAAQWLRDRLMPRAMAIRSVHDLSAALCADLVHHYRGSPCVGEERRRWAPWAPRLSRKAPRPGDRAPDLELAGGTWLSDHLAALDHTLLLFCGEGGAAEPRLAGLAQAVLRRSGAPIEVRRVVIGRDGAGALADPEGALHRLYGARRAGSS